MHLLDAGKNFFDGDLAIDIPVEESLSVRGDFHAFNLSRSDCVAHMLGALSLANALAGLRHNDVLDSEFFETVRHAPLKPHT